MATVARIGTSAARAKQPDKDPRSARTAPSPSARRRPRPSRRPPARRRPTRDRAQGLADEVAGAAQKLTRERAQEIADELAGAAQRVGRALRGPPRRRSGDEVRELRRRLDDLERRVGRPGGPARGRRRSPPAASGGTA